MRGVVFSEPAVNAPERPPVADRHKGVTPAILPTVGGGNLFLRTNI